MAIMTMQDLRRFDGQAYWFLAHGVVDVLLAVALFIAPVTFLELLGWAAIDTIAARIVAAALVGIGVESILGCRAEFTAVKAILNLKILWAAAAIIGLLWSGLAAPAFPWGIWPILAIFVVFLSAWIVYRIRISGLAGK